MTTNEDPRLFVSLERTINLGNYENVKFAIGVSNLPIHATDEQIEQAMATASTSFSKLKTEMMSKIAEAKKIV